MLPKVILHSAVSVDGRLDHFQPSLELYYSLAGRFGEDLTLLGADTLLAVPPGEIPPEDDSAFKPLSPAPDDPRPLAAVVDSRGRVRLWHALKAWPYWRGHVALISASTPVEHRAYLRERHIETIETGDTRVDLRSALEILAERYRVKTVRVDAGGSLNGALLRAGVVAEISVLWHPALVGGESPKSLFRAPDLAGPDGVIPLQLTSVETLDGGVVWGRWEVRNKV
ncbi:MAG: RibD family protein [Candidatus Zixiibacteriota bacterium]|nr:MAG: RibD family protein [candidate division Zixibacteria bacterium]